MAKFRIDQDGDGNAEISPQKPQKLRSLDDEGEAPKPAIKSAMKGGTKSTAPAARVGSKESAPAPKSALKSALKSAPIPEPDEEPAAAPAKPTPKKSALKKSPVAPEPAPPAEAPSGKPAPRPGAAKSALKSKQPPPEPAAEERYASKESKFGSNTSEGEKPASPKAGDRRGPRPSTFKMNISLTEDDAWSVRGLARHYFNFALMKIMWEDNAGDANAGRRKSRKSIKVSEILLPGAASQEATPSAEPAPQDVISPLKDVFIEKKPDGNKARDILSKMAVGERSKWVNAPLDATPPPMPSPLHFAVASVHAHLVEVLIDFGVDVTAQYPGKSNLKGWLKPNSPLVESVAGRKGRFVGTMLGDKLESIERMLKTAINAQKAAEGLEPNSPVINKPGPMKQRRKSVQMKCSQGMMEHTHDHPSSRYELVAYDDGVHYTASAQNVREAVNIASGEVYAIKAGSKIDETVTDPEAELWNEIGIIRKLDHPNIVRLHETFENDTHIFMVLEGCLGGGLFDRMVSHGTVEEPAALRIAYQIGSALRHLHQIQICHRDLQPEALFLAESGPLIETGVKIIDFSTAKEFTSATRMISKVCALHYVAPEILKDGGYTEKVDIWAFGVLLYTLLSGAPPFNSEDDLEILSLVKEGKYGFTPAGLWDGISSDTKDLISKCLTVDEVQRPDVWGIMQTPAMTNAEAKGAVYVASETLGRSNDGRSAQNAVTAVTAAFSMIAEVITDKQVAELSLLFKSLDTSETGMIELEDAVGKLKEMVKDNSQATELIKLLNTGISGRVNYLMYMATMTDRRRQLRREASRAVYNSLDIDKNGKISLYEIAQMLEKDASLEAICQSGLKAVTVNEVRKIWVEMKTTFDISKNGEKISDREMTFDEFFKELPNNHDSGF